MEYFYTPPHLITSPHLIIEGDEFAHLTHVMRKQVGDTIRVVDGAGTAYDATIVEIGKSNKDKRTARCEITGTHKRLHEPDIEVTLGVAILKNFSRFDFLVEKVTELGVNTIVPLTTERTIARSAKVERWQKLALAAMKQSGRCILPAVRELQAFGTFIRSIPPAAAKFIPHEKADRLLGSWVTKVSTSAALCIGPEGGFSDAEIASAIESSFQPVSLGQRRLRTETAAIVAVGQLLCSG